MRDVRSRNAAGDEMPKAPQIWKDWPACQTCNGAGVEYGETCMGCGGSGRDAECCSKCEQRGIGFNEDGRFLCEDCLFEEQAKDMEALQEEEHRMNDD